MTTDLKVTVIANHVYLMSKGSITLIAGKI